MKSVWLRPLSNRLWPRRVHCICAVSVLAVATSMASAQSPKGGAVASGNAKISQSGKSTVVKQSSQRAVVDWESFDVGRDHTVDFQQPGRSSATLNRVQSHKPSLVQGSIKAPGTVVIQNTAGVTFSGTARVDVGGILATSQIVDADHFMRTGNFRIGGGERPGARVENAGRFTIDSEGLAALVGSNVTNSGTIVAHMGTVVLASGTTTAIDLAGDGVLQVTVDGAPQGGSVTQSGDINAGGGRVLLTAGGAAGMLDSVINTSGVTRAVGESGTGGRIELVGRGGGTVNVSGQLDASGSGTGGSITVTGEEVNLSETARLDASGATGGEIFIGGELQGGGDLRRAQRTVLNFGSEVRAEGSTGAGGTVIVWSDGTTWFDGLIAAEGAMRGGFVETSGKINLGTGNAAQVRVGSGGQWLLDPRNVRIANSGTNIGPGTTNPPDAVGTFQIRRASITTALNAGSDVTITTVQPGQNQPGDITVDSNIRWNGSGTLTLLADGSIRVNRTVEARGDGAITLTAGEMIDARRGLVTRGAGDITLTAGTSVDTRALRAFGGGDVTVNAATELTTNGLIEARSGGSITLDAGGTTDLRSTVQTRGAGDLTVLSGAALETRTIRTLGTGDIALTAAGDITTRATIEARSDGNISLDAGGALDVNRNIQSRGTGDITLDANNDITFDRNVQALGTGDLTVTGGGHLFVNRTAQTRGGDLSIDVAGNIQLQQQITARNGGSVTAKAGGSIFVDRSTRMRGYGDMSLIAGDRIEVNQQIRRDGTGDLTLQAQNDIAIDHNVFANSDGSITVLSQSGDIAFGGANGNQRISTNRGDVNLTATTGSVIIERTNTRPRNTQVYASNGDIDIAAGTEIRLKGGDQNRAFARIGRSGDASDISLAAPTVKVIAGDVSQQGTAQVIAGRGGSIIVDANLLQIENGATGTLASVDAVNGASLTLEADVQQWRGRVRAIGNGPTGGDVTLNGNITATVAPVFDLNDGADFALNTGNPTGGLDAPGVSFDVTTTGGTIGVNGSLDANDIALITDTGVSLGATANLTASGPGNALVVSAANQFDNAGGSNVFNVTDPSARWLLYMNNFASLQGVAPASGTFDLYNRSFAANSPGGLGAFTGSRIVYAEQPKLAIAADDLSKAYGADGTSLLSFSTNGLRSGDTLANALTGTVTLGSVGTDPTADVFGGPYTIAISATASAQGYSVVTADGTLTVDPAPLTVSAQDARRPVGTPNPPFNADIDGFVLGQDENALNGVLGFSTTATIDSPDGLFPIAPFGLSADNYAINFVDGMLTVGTGQPPLAEPLATPFVADGVNDAGAQSLRLAGLRGTPATPGDATFRVSNRDVALAETDPFTLSFSLGEVLAFSASAEPITDAGFVPAAGPVLNSEGFVPAAGTGEAAQEIDCGAAVNLGAADRGACQSVPVVENYWDTR